MQCIKCGYENRPQVRFCENFGQAMAVQPVMPPGVTCPSCGTQNRAGVRFCENCGASLYAPPTPVPSQPAYQPPAPVYDYPPPMENRRKGTGPLAAFLAGGLVLLLLLGLGGAVY